MTRREIVLNKLQALSEDEEINALENLETFIKARLRIGSKFDRTKSGAFSKSNLGEEDPMIYFRDMTLEALYKPNGWDWKFEERSFSEQLIRIANKLISKEVEKYKRKQIKESIPQFVDSDVGEVLDKLDREEENTAEYKEFIEQFINLTIEITKDDEDLNYFTIRYFDNADFETIASEMSKTKEEVYKFKRKLLRRLESRKSEIQGR